MAKFLDRTGQKFGRLTVIKFTGRNKHRNVIWLCKCKCGNEKDVLGDSLRDGRTTSCGCVKKEMVTAKNTKHGHFVNRKGSKTYNAWSGIVNRFNNPNYLYYESKCRTNVCGRWLGKDGFINFLADMGECPKDLILYRIDINKDFGPGNCKWATRKEHLNNRSNNRIIEFNGESHTPSEWSEITGINSSTIIARLDIRGWSVERALTEEINDKERLIDYKGDLLTLTDCSKMTGINRDTIRLRLDRGWSIEKSLSENINQRDSETERMFFNRIKSIYPNAKRKISVKTKNSSLIPDILFSKDKIIVEFYGDYWHANPTKYIRTDIIHNGMSAGEIWERDLIRKESLEKMGYKVLEVWEGDYRKNPESIIKNLCDIID